MNNDLQAVIGGSKTVAQMLGRRRCVPRKEVGTDSVPFSAARPHGRGPAPGDENGSSQRDNPGLETQLSVRARLREAGRGYAFVVVPLVVFGIFFL
jgi:hypothetical protein